MARVNYDRMIRDVCYGLAFVAIVAAIPILTGWWEVAR